MAAARQFLASNVIIYIAVIDTEYHVNMTKFDWKLWWTYNSANIILYDSVLVIKQTARGDIADAWYM